MSNFSKNTPTPNSRAINKQKPQVIKPLIPKLKSKQASAATFFQPRAPHADEKTVEERKEKAENLLPETQVPAAENTENKRPKTGFQMWLEENRASILANNPDLEEADVIKEGMSRFRVLSSDERMVWTEKAKGATASNSAEAKKRKRPADAKNEGKERLEEKSKENSSLPKKQKPLDQSTNVKLSAFAFKKS
uniref:WD repeat and HMG-box DNA-binding protein 1 n=1 Tax=Pelusios castaneus TaxID=367368 RepID=A0A8C8RC90_9SAUR